MADDKKSKNDEKEPTVRKRVKVIEEVVEEPEQPEEESADESAQGDERYKSEHDAGSKVRVARSADGADAPKPKPKAKKPGRRAVTIEKKSEEEEKAEEKKREREKQRKKEQELLEIKSYEPDVTTADFEALLAGDAGAAAPQQADIAAGDRIEGTVAAVGDKFIFVEFGSSKIEGVASREDFLDEDEEVTVEPGETHEFYVLSVSSDEIRLGKKLSGREGAMEAIHTAHDTGVPVEGRVDSTNKGGFEVMIGQVRAFCPISQIELGYTEEPSVHVGNTYRFRVSKVSEGGRNVVVSRTELLEEERKARREETLKTLEEGEVVSGKVTRVADFGAFVDIGGIEGLVHVSELSHGFFDHPSDVVSPGDSVEVKILKIEEQKDGDLRIGLSVKETESSPWEEVNKKFAVGQEVEGEVVRLAPFGAFVQIAPGLDGLVHVSEMSWEKHVKHPRDVVSPGDKVRVQVQDIDQIRERISLSMKAVEGDPWDTADERYPVGTEATGTVENIEDFGAFVRLEGGITALIPRSEMDLPSGVTPHRKYSVGEEVTATVLNVDPVDRKMALTEKSADEVQASGAGSRKPRKSKKKSSGGGSRSYTDEGSSGGGFGTLGDLLGGKLDED